MVRAIGAAPGLEVVRRCADVSEVLAAAAARLGGVAVLSEDLPGLDLPAVEHLRTSGVRIVIVADLWTDVLRARARALGADATATAGTPSEVVTAVEGALTLHERTAPREGASIDGLSGAPDDCPGLAGGRVVAVWGPTGAPGRTTVAVNLAAELAEARRRQGSTVLLVDADTYGGTVAQVLGLLDEAPGIAAAARAAGAGRLDGAALAALTPVLESDLRVLTGISRADRWPELPAASLDVVWRAARSLAAWTVVDCGFCLEEDEALSYDTRAPRRNGATLSALAAADVVVVVGAGDPVGLQRLVRGLADLADLGLVSQRVVVVNRVRAAASGPRPREAVRDALRRYAGVEAVRVLPDDRATCDGALLRAKTLLEHAPSAPVRRGLAALAGEVLSLGARVGAH